jgi:acyl-CoA thioester hydrolase
MAINNVVFQAVAHPWMCDAMLHLTTRHYMAMFDDASYHFLHKVFGWTATQVKDDGIGFADVKHVIEYQAEVGSGELLSVSAQLTKLGGKSMTVLYSMYNSQTEELVATLESTSVLFDTNARKAIAFSDDWRVRATDYLA